MPKRAAGLSARKVETLKTPGLFADGDGLYLQVGAAGARSWIFRYQLGGRRRDMGLGSVSDLPLADARERVREARRQVAAGVDPFAWRKEFGTDMQPYFWAGFTVIGDGNRKISFTKTKPAVEQPASFGVR